MEYRQIVNEDGLTVVEAYEDKRCMGVIIPAWNLYLAQPAAGKSAVFNDLRKAVHYMERNVKTKIRRGAQLAGRHPINGSESPLY